MPYDVMIGRIPTDKEKFGKEGTILLGKQYVKMGQVTSLSNEVLLDVSRSHVVFVCGKRGSGKSYTLGVIAEGIAALPEHITQNLSVLIFDTMGIFWTMKYPNHKDEELLREWNLEGKSLPIQLYTPIGFFKEFKDKGMPADHAFAIDPSELDPMDWCTTFSINPNEELGVFIIKIISELKKRKFSLPEIISAIKADVNAPNYIKDGAANRFSNAQSWGLFAEKSTAIKDLIAPGQTTVIDLSPYATLPGAAGVRALVIGLISQKLFEERMVARAGEEFENVQEAVHYFSYEGPEKKEMPLVWLMVDEAHEFLPNVGKTTATDALVTILREGRQPGISLVLASQQPGKIHTDVMTQADVVIAHRLTAKVDVDALGMLMQSYMRTSLDQQIDNLPRVTGAAIVFDDINERMYPVRIRPRASWHGGEAPAALKEEKKLFEF